MSTGILFNWNMVYFSIVIYTKEDSLILSASIDGKRIETIEISISQLKVIQSRGVCNQNTEHHNSIINLVNQNLQLIEERLVA